MFSGRHLVRSVILLRVRCLRSQLPRSGDDGRARYARRPSHVSPLGSAVLAAVAEAVHQAKARGHLQEMNSMMGKDKRGTPSLRLHRSPSSAKSLLPEQSRL